MAGKKQVIEDVATATVVTSDELPIVSGDVGIIAFMGRDYELTVIATSPRLNYLVVDQSGKRTGPEEVNMELTYRTTAKVRLGPVALAQIGGGMLRALQDNEPELFRQTIASLTESDQAEHDEAVH